MADDPLLEVEWLWKPYIHFGKVSIVQGNPGEAFHERKTHYPFNVIYQTVEEGLGDTINLRLIEAKADHLKGICH